MNDFQKIFIMQTFRSNVEGMYNLNIVVYEITNLIILYLATTILTFDLYIFIFNEQSKNKLLRYYWVIFVKINIIFLSWLHHLVIWHNLMLETLEIV